MSIWLRFLMANGTKVQIWQGLAAMSVRDAAIVAGKLGIALFWTHGISICLKKILGADLRNF